jgi:trehalose/maltose hydrolase-like predicted phosphorylase
LRRGVLTRQVRFRDAKARTTMLYQRRFVHMGCEHLAVLETTITAEDWSGRLRIRSGLDGTVGNTGVARYRRLSGCHLAPVAAEAYDAETLLLVVQTTQSHIRIAQAARTRLYQGGKPCLVERQVVHGDVGQLVHELTTILGAGCSLTVEKTVALATSRDRAISEPGAAALGWLRSAAGFEELLGQHALAWAHLWDRFDVGIVGDDQAQLLVRLHLFHLLVTLSPHSAEADVGVPARGLHGEAYRGHVFWDELFVFPLFNLRLPALTRALLLYRYRRLPAARHAAREAGFAGAMYPWQSGSDGWEESQRLHLNPMSGRWLPDPTYLQRHVGSAVAYNVWRYYEATGDREFLAEHGAELLLEIARFWASATVYDPDCSRYRIRGIVGPDEFHTGYPGAAQPGIDDNAYTNVMAAWVLAQALDTLTELPVRRRRELTETLGLCKHDYERWDEISRAMFVPFHDDGAGGAIISQFAGYESLAELDWEGYRRKYGDIQRLDRLLEAEGDSPNRYRLSKQADVLMLFYLLSADELYELLGRLGYRFGPQDIPRTVGYYLVRTSHGSTLSALVHAWVLARGHRRDRAVEYFRRVLVSDVADVQGGTTPEGIHLAAIAGSVDLLQRCFAGVDTRGDVLRIDPSWPRQLGVLEFNLVYCERVPSVRITSDRVRVGIEDGLGTPIRLDYRGRVIDLVSSGAIEFPIGVDLVPC